MLISGRCSVSASRKVPSWLVVVQVVALEVVVADEQVRPAILVHVAHRHSQPEADGRRVDARRLGHVLEAGRAGLGEQVFKEFIAPLGVRHFPQSLAQVIARRSPGAVVEQVAVQVAVAVVVEEGGVHAQAHHVQAVLRTRLPKGKIPLVDEQLVVPHPGHARDLLSGRRSSFTDVDIL